METNTKPEVKTAFHWPKVELEVPVETTDYRAGQLWKWTFELDLDWQLAISRKLANRFEVAIMQDGRFFLALLGQGRKFVEERKLESFDQAMQACEDWAFTFGGWAEEAGQ